MANEGRFEDRGFFSQNKKRSNERAPSHTGKITLSETTLQALIELQESGQEASLELAGWRKEDNPGMVSLKVSLPRQRDEDGGGRPQGRGGGSGPRRNNDRRGFQQKDFGDQDDLL